MRQILLAGLLLASSAGAQTYYTDQYNTVVGASNTVGDITYYTDHQNTVIGYSQEQKSSTYYTNQRNEVIGYGSTQSVTPQQNYPYPIYNQPVRR
jgi:hypothetical protein